jgi:hypothetical protein
MVGADFGEEINFQFFLRWGGKGVDLKAHDGCVGVVYPGLRGLKAHLPGAS